MTNVIQYKLKQAVASFEGFPGTMDISHLGTLEEVYEASDQIAETDGDWNFYVWIKSENDKVILDYSDIEDI